MIEIGAEAAVATAAEVAAKEAFLRVLAVTHPLAPVALRAAKGFVAKIAVVQVATVDGILAPLQQLSVVTILAVFRRIDEVTIFAVPSPRGESRVFIPEADQGHSWHITLQRRELLKE